MISSHETVHTDIYSACGGRGDIDKFLSPHGAAEISCSGVIRLNYLFQCCPFSLIGPTAVRENLV
jgi:hypothetical protein